MSKLNFRYYCSPPAAPWQSTRGLQVELWESWPYRTTLLPDMYSTAKIIIQSCMLVHKKLIWCAQVVNGFE